MVRTTFPLEEAVLAATSEPKKNVHKILVRYFVSALVPPITA